MPACGIFSARGCVYMVVVTDRESFKDLGQHHRFLPFSLSLSVHHVLGAFWYGSGIIRRSDSYGPKMFDTTLASFYSLMIDRRRQHPSPLLRKRCFSLCLSPFCRSFQVIDHTFVVQLPWSAFFFLLLLSFSLRARRESRFYFSRTVKHLSFL